MVAADRARKWLKRREGRISGLRTAEPTPGSRRHSGRRYDTRLAVEKEIERHRSITVNLQRAGISHLTLKERGRWISMLSRLVRQLPEQQSRPGADDPTSQDPLRSIAGRRMEELLDSMSLASEGSPAYHEAALRIDAMSLQGNLPSMLASPTDSSSDSRVSLYASSLRAIFIQDYSSEPHLAEVSRGLRRATFAKLLDCWLRSSNGPEQAVRFMCGWSQHSLVDPSLEEDRWRAHCRFLRRQYGQLLARLEPSPAQWLAEHLAPTSGQSRASLRTIAEVMATAGSPLESLQIWHQLFQTRGKPAIEDVHLMATILEGLLQNRCLQDAQDLAIRVRNSVKQILPSLDEDASDLLRIEFAEMSEADAATVVYALRMVARNAAQHGNTSWTETTLSSLRVLGRLSPEEKAARQIRAASKNNRVEGARSIFDYAVKDPSLSKQSLSRLYSSMVVAYVRVDNLEAASQLLQQMLEANVSPQVQLVNSLLFGYAARHDVDGTYAVFQRLVSGTLIATPDVHSYHALVTAHCNVRDIESAQDTILRMRDARIQPTQAVWTTMMNAYVELADWQRAFEIYAFLEKHADPRYHPDTASFNVLLKACVLSSAPAQTVLQVFQQWLGRGLRPNSATYTLLMQSVCTAGLMDVAEALFKTIDTAKVKGNLPVSMDAVEPDVFIFSNMIAGYVKTGNRVKARACLTEMRRRGIEPTSVTYAVIVGSFIRPHNDIQSKKGAADASKFALEFLSSSPLESVRHRQLVRLDRALARGDELNYLFAPVLQAQAKQGSAAVALATFRLVLDSGAKPSIELYTILMDAYRRQDDAELAADNVETVWSGLHNSVLRAFASEQVVEESEDADDVKGREKPKGPRRSRLRIHPSQSHALCVPLSIYIEAFDKAGRTFDIRRTWNTLARQGFTFDSSNWNLLATHYARVYDLEKACWIIEHVLLKPPTLNTVTDQDSSLQTTLQFATVGKSSLAAPRRTPSRLESGRKIERDAHVKSPIDLERFFTDEAVDGPDVFETARTASDKRRRDHWFPHANLLAAVDDALNALVMGRAEKGSSAADEREPLSLEEAQEMQQRLQARYPETFNTLRYRADRAEGRKHMTTVSL